MEQKILDLIGKGSKSSPVTRESLASSLNISDRAIRRSIESLRVQGNRICSGPIKPGYYIADTEEEYRRFRGRYLAYAKRQIYIIHKMDGEAGYIDYDAVIKGLSPKAEGE